MHASTNAAAEVRERLAASRARGMPFDRSWQAAVRCATRCPREASYSRQKQASGWREALAWARPAFEAAYNGAEAEAPERSARSLEEAAA